VGLKVRQRLKAIFFVLDGTLLDDGDAITQALSLACHAVHARWPEIDEYTLAAVYRQVSEAAWSNYDRDLRPLVHPEAMIASVWRAALARWQVDDPNTEREAAEVYWTHRLRNCVPYDDVSPHLAELAAKLPLYLLTNGAPAMQRAKAAASGLAPLFQQIFVGGDFPRGKPDEAIFRAALTDANCHPTQAVHIGDSLTHDIAGAQNVGVSGVWINRKGVAAPDGSPSPDGAITTLIDLWQCLEQLAR
jgi:putative hydrolase of the HAD superfamily